MKIINEEHLGTNATREQAEQVIKFLRDLGYDVEYGPDSAAQTVDEDGNAAEEIPDAVWMSALNAIK
jgi:methylmalonyl-CoA mutase cobalamin-binding subunit